MDQHDKGRTIVEQQKRGLDRLKAAVKEAPGVIRRTRETVVSRARHVRLCQAITPEDTYETIAQRCPALGTADQIAKALSVLRRSQLPGLFFPNVQIPPYTIAAAYLGNLPRGYRLPTDD